MTAARSGPGVSESVFPPLICPLGYFSHGYAEVINTDDLLKPQCVASSPGAIFQVMCTSQQGLGSRVGPRAQALGAAVHLPRSHLLVLPLFRDGKSLGHGATVRRREAGFGNGSTNSCLTRGAGSPGRQPLLWIPFNSCCLRTVPHSVISFLKPRPTDTFYNTRR